MNLDFWMVVWYGHSVFNKPFNVFSLLLGKGTQAILVKVVSFVYVFMVKFSHSKINTEITWNIFLSFKSFSSGTSAFSSCAYPKPSSQLIWLCFVWPSQSCPDRKFYNFQSNEASKFKWFFWQREDLAWTWFS